MPRTPSKKGKKAARVAEIQADEQTPLLRDSSETSLASCSPSAEFTEDTPGNEHVHKKTRERSVCIAVSSILFGLVFFVVLFSMALFVFPHADHDWRRSFVYESPTVDVLDVSDSGVKVNVSMLGGVDVDTVLDSDGPSWFDNARKTIKQALANTLPLPGSVNVSVPEVLVYRKGGGLPLLNVTLHPITLPLYRGEKKQFSVVGVGQPIAPIDQIWRWAQDAWASGSADIVFTAHQVSASVPGHSWLGVDMSDISAPMSLEVPTVPNWPKPGKPLDLNKLVQLRSYSFSNDDGLSITGDASIPNPGLKTLPFHFAFPFSIGLNGSSIATVVAKAASVDEHDIGVSIDGDITTRDVEPMAIFLRRYLHGRDIPVTVTGRNNMPPDYDGPQPPDWALRTLPSLSLNLTFPGPKPKPNIVKEVSIEGMKIAEGAGGHIAASGTVVALIKLPGGFERVNLNVSSILPDVFIYDGPVDQPTAIQNLVSDLGFWKKKPAAPPVEPPEEEDPSDRPDPTDPPARAFAIIHPAEYLPASTEASPDIPHALIVRAPFEGIPLNVLSGRQGVFRGFVSKILFKGGATAGIGGVADVQVDLGLPNEFQVTDLPVQGEFWVKR